MAHTLVQIIQGLFSKKRDYELKEVASGMTDCMYGSEGFHRGDVSLNDALSNPQRYSISGVPFYADQTTLSTQIGTFYTIQEKIPKQYNREVRV